MTFWPKLRVGKRKGGRDAKMGNKPSVCALGHSHRSKLESAVCHILQLREKANEIKILQIEDHVAICGPTGHDCPKKKIYIPDFKCYDIERAEEFWVEAKGFPNDRWPTTKVLWRHYGPGRLEIWMGSHTNPKLDEIITPIPYTVK